MSVKKKRIIRSDLQPGARVISAACGAKGSFTGTVLWKFDGLSYHVEEDGTAQVWHRDLSELRRVRP